MRARDRKLDTLVPADRPLEYDALFRIRDRRFREPARVANGFRRHQYALGIHAVQNIAKAPALFADQVLRRHAHAVEEHFSRVVIDHGGQRLDLQALAEARVDIEQEYRQALRFLLHLVQRRRARQQQHEVRVQRARRPYFLPVNHIVVAITHRAGLEPGRISTRRRFGDGERLQPQFPARNPRQVACLLLRAAMPQQSTHDVHLRVTRARVAARGVDFLEYHCGRAQRQARTTVFLGNQRGEIAGAGQCLDELGRISLTRLEITPVRPRKINTDPAHAGANLGIILAERNTNVFDTGSAHSCVDSLAQSGCAALGGTHVIARQACPRERTVHFDIRQRCADDVPDRKQLFQIDAGTQPHRIEHEA